MIGLELPGILPGLTPEDRCCQMRADIRSEAPRMWEELELLFDEQPALINDVALHLALTDLAREFTCSCNTNIRHQLDEHRRVAWYYSPFEGRVAYTHFLKRATLFDRGRLKFHYDALKARCVKIAEIDLEARKATDPAVASYLFFLQMLCCAYRASRLLPYASR